MDGGGWHQDFRLQEIKTCCCNLGGLTTEDSTWYILFLVFVDLADITINNKMGQSKCHRIYKIFMKESWIKSFGLLSRAWCPGVICYKPPCCLCNPRNWRWRNCVKSPWFPECPLPRGAATGQPALGPLNNIWTIIWTSDSWIKQWIGCLKKKRMIYYKKFI